MAIGQVAGAVARGEQQRRALLAGEVEEVKQRTLVSGRGGILDNERPGRERMRQLGRAERTAGNDARSRRPRPDRREMGFSGALRSDQGDGIRGPVRPALDQAERGFVARSGEKIIARVAFSVIERERELTRAKGHGASSTIGKDGHRPSGGIMLR